MNTAALAAWVVVAGLACMARIAWRIYDKHPRVSGVLQLLLGVLISAIARRVGWLP